MRRGLGFLLVGLGVFLVVLGILLRTWAYPALAKAPLDQDSRTVSVAEDATYLDVGALEIVDGATLVATREVKGDVAAGGDEVAVWDVFVSVDNEAGDLVSASTDRVAFDRHTSEAVNCCGESLNGEPTEHQGIEYKFPFNTEKRSYQYFDTTLGQASDMEYVESEEVAGVDVYRFEQRIDPVKIAELTVPGALVGSTEASVTVDRFYSNLRRVWVEPTTGVIVKGQEEQFATLRDASGQDVLTITQATLTFDDATIREQADTAKDNARLLSLLRTTGPLVAVLLGVVLLGLGLALSLRREDDAYRDDGRLREPAQV